MFNKDTYSESQKVVLNKGLSKDPRFGDVSDLNPEKFSSRYMLAVSFGRGNCRLYGNIDRVVDEFVNKFSDSVVELDVNETTYRIYSSDALSAVSMGLGSCSHYSDISDLVCKDIDYTLYSNIAIVRNNPNNIKYFITNKRLLQLALSRQENKTAIPEIATLEKILKRLDCIK